MTKRQIRAGDTVLHVPSGRMLVAACDQERENVYVCVDKLIHQDWFSAAECVVLAPASEQTRFDVLTAVVAAADKVSGPYDPRGNAARSQLDAMAASE